MNFIVNVSWSFQLSLRLHALCWPSCSPFSIGDFFTLLASVRRHTEEHYIRRILWFQSQTLTESCLSKTFALRAKGPCYPEQYQAYESGKAHLLFSSLLLKVVIKLQKYKQTSSTELRDVICGCILRACHVKLSSLHQNILGLLKNIYLRTVQMIEYLTFSGQSCSTNTRPLTEVGSSAWSSVRWNINDELCLTMYSRL